MKYNGLCKNRLLAHKTCAHTVLPFEGICASLLDVCCAVQPTTDRHDNGDVEHENVSICRKLYKGTCVTEGTSAAGDCKKYGGVSDFICPERQRCCTKFHTLPTTKADQSCGEPIKPVNEASSGGWRIVNGLNATHGSWPWMVSLQVYNQHFCGGTIIDDQWVLSAAHCFRSHAAGEITAVVGEHRLDNEEESEADHDIQQIFIHKGYVPSSSSSPNDIALVRLKTPVRYNSHVRKVCLPEHEIGYFDEYQDCHITGWGDTNNKADKKHLQQFSYESLSLKECRYRWADYLIKDSHICIGRGEGGACMGDSGGPMVCREDGKFYQVGVTSFGGKDCEGEGFPNVYTRVNTFMGWVNKVQKIYGLLEEEGKLAKFEGTTLTV